MFINAAEVAFTFSDATITTMSAQEQERNKRLANLLHRPAALRPFTSLTDISEPSPFQTAAHRISVRVLDYGNGYLEASVGRVGIQGKKAKAEMAPSPQTAQRKADNWERATRRAKQSVRRLVLANGFDRILTLTTRACIDDPKTFWAMWKRFLRLARDAGFDMPYVAVLEYQKRGAAHIHAAVSGHYPHEALRALWLRVIGGAIPRNHPSLAREGGEFAPNDGSVQLEYRSDTNPARLACYLSKYLSKQVAEDLEGAHRFRASLGLHRAAVKQFYLAGDRKLGDIAAEALRSEGAKGSAALGSDMFGWACNWDKRGNIISG